MTRTIKIYVVALVLLFIGVTIIEFSKPKPINWSKTYNETHTSPYGTYVLFNELPNIFPEVEIEELGITPYEHFNSFFNWESNNYDIAGTYMYIDETLSIDEISAQELLDFASYGNDIFISSSYLPEVIKDTLGIELMNEYNFTGKADLIFANNRIKRDSIRIEKGLSNIYFSELDSTFTTVLGYQRFSFEEKINFVKVDYGSGRFFLHLQPVVFTNYNLLKDDNSKYTEAVLSYIDDDKLYFDSRNKKRNVLSRSPMRFILSQPALKWAWILGLLTILVFVIFNAKRKQRVVRIIKPNENTTVAFTKTIGNLYYETKDHDNVIDKKITYFLEYVRRVYFLDTQILDDKFMKYLALKSGKKQSTIKKLINLIAHLRAKTACNEDDLLELSRAIENFHNP